MTHPQHYFYNTYMNILYNFHTRVLLVHKFIYLHNTVRYCHMTIGDMII